MSEFAPNECACNRCVNMCKHAPCWPTPNEARALIAAGLGDRLMTDWWSAQPRNVHLLTPAVVGYEKRLAPTMPFEALFMPGWIKGRCTFLDASDRCELHDRGLKPFEGRVMRHDSTGEMSRAVREHVVQLWRAEQDKFQFHGDSNDVDGWPDREE